MMRHTDQKGVALVSALLVLMLMSAMLAGFLVMVNADQAAGGIDRDQTQAYGAAHGGVEKLTADLGQLFNGNFSPTGAQLAELTTAEMEPNLPGISFVRPNGSPGYRINFIDNNGDGNPDVADPNGTTIATEPYQGLRGLITPYTIEVTARTLGNAEVRMRRTMQTVAIPVFQFGIFSENNQSFFAGPNFAFGGRVHTNQHLFLKQGDGTTLTLQDRVTAVGEVIRTHLANDETSNIHDGTVRVAKAAGCPAAPTAINNALCFNLLDTRGSLENTLGSAENEPEWTDVSVGTSNGWLKNGRTGARRLDLPIVSDGATPIDLIRRPPVGEAANSAIGQQRFFNLGTLRILLSDRPENLVGGAAPPGTVGAPIRLSNVHNVPAEFAGSLPAGNHPFAQSTGALNDGFRTVDDTPSIDGWILINLQDRDRNWTDVTQQILSLGFSGRRLSTGNPGVLDSPDFNNGCPEPHANAIIRVQRTRDTLGGANCGGASASGDDYWPNVLYDPREGMLRDDQNARPTAPNGLPAPIQNGQPRLYWGGVMHYVELDVNNLRRWLRGEIGTLGAGCINGAGGGNCPMDVTGFVVYFSDRRTNRNLGADGLADPAAFDGQGPVYLDDVETGEFGYEDIINPGSAASQPNTLMDGAFVDAQGVNRWAEDVNQNGAVVPLPETYGGTARLMPAASMNLVAAAPALTPLLNQYELYGANGVFGRPIDRNVARVNRAFFFRRALKLVNGGRGNLPANGTQGLTVASENPVYVQGNYNACTNAVPTQPNFAPACTGAGFDANPGVDHVSAAVIADAVTFLSNAWNDIRSFRDPHNADTNGLVEDDARQAATTWYRLGIIAGKGLNFTRPTNNANDHADFGTDGGAHNFIRYIENWGGATLNYRGSLISFFTSRQGVGIYKCCNIVYNPPTRGYNFDPEFLNPNLLPPRTPMFRDINTLSFRQILRPTQ